MKNDTSPSFLAENLPPTLTKSKSETSLFPPTLKVEAYKLDSDFDFEAQGESYGCFVIFNGQFHFLVLAGGKIDDIYFL